MMNNEQFIEFAKGYVRGYAEKHLDATHGKVDYEVFVVWSCFILGHQKCLISTTLHDGMYYEITYNSNKDQIYFDAYKKFENICIEDKKG